MAGRTGAREFRIDLFHYEEDDVFVITSEDIPGLVLEAETFGRAMDALMEYGPRLIKTNLGLPLEGEFRFVVTHQKASEQPEQAPRKRAAKPRVPFRIKTDFPQSMNLPVFATAR